MIISEEEAKQFRDLYDFEIWCIDFLRGVKALRQQTATDGEFTRGVAIDAGKAMQAKIPELLREIDDALGEVMLKELRPGAIFVTREGIYAVKSEYRYGSEVQSQYQCVLLESGEYAHFRAGNATLVREVRIGL